MGDLVPRDPRIDRPTFERIIQRAAELQARERDVGEGLSEAELMQLGDDVGIPAAYLRQALLEERSSALRTAEQGILSWIAGPRRVLAERSMNGEPEKLEALLRQWMAEGELLQVKRRLPDRTSWEPRHGAYASLKRSLGFGGRTYQLARAREVVGRITPLDGPRCLVQLVADVGNVLNEHLAGATVLGGSGGAVTGIALAAGVLTPVALIPALLAAPLAFGIARSHRRKAERFHVALEQVLDRLQHGEIEVPAGPGRAHHSGFAQLAEEIKKNLGV